MIFDQACTKMNVAFYVLFDLFRALYCSNHLTIKNQISCKVPVKISLTKVESKVVSKGKTKVRLPIKA